MGLQTWLFEEELVNLAALNGGTVILLTSDEMLLLTLTVWQTQRRSV